MRCSVYDDVRSNFTQVFGYYFELPDINPGSSAEWDDFVSPGFSLLYNRFSQKAETSGYRSPITHGPSAPLIQMVPPLFVVLPCSFEKHTNVLYVRIHHYFHKFFELHLGTPAKNLLGFRTVAKQEVSVGRSQIV